MSDSRVYLFVCENKVQTPLQITSYRESFVTVLDKRMKKSEIYLVERWLLIKLEKLINCSLREIR